MKATLEFNVPEEDNEFRLAINGGKYLSALLEFKSILRNLIKHGYDPALKTPDDMLREIDRQFRTSTEDVNFDEVQ
jgi:hypothetical protein